MQAKLSCEKKLMEGKCKPHCLLWFRFRFFHLSIPSDLLTNKQKKNGELNLLRFRKCLLTKRCPGQNISQSPTYFLYALGVHMNFFFLLSTCINAVLCNLQLYSPLFGTALLGAVNYSLNQRCPIELFSAFRERPQSYTVFLVVVNCDSSI